MKLLVVAVGHRPPDWVSAGFADYAARMPRDAAVTLVPIKPEARGAKGDRPGEVDRVRQAEAKRITAALPAGCVKVALDERGRSWSTETLSGRLGEWQAQGRDVAFVVGGADGLSETVRQDADFVWSLSALTLPHGLVRVILAEQLYRAMTILKGHPYHRGSTRDL